MVAEAGISGAEKLTAVGRRLKLAGDGELRKELLSGIRAAGLKTLPAIRRSAGSYLPKAGGLADSVAGQKFAVRTSLATGRVQIVGEGMKELTDIDRGRLRKPVFGNRDVWVGQSVTPRFFTRPIEDSEPLMRVEIEHVMSETASKIERPL